MCAQLHVQGYLTTLANLWGVQYIRNSIRSSWLFLMTGESSWHGWKGENFCLSLLSGSCMIMLFRVSTLVDPYNEFAFVTFLLLQQKYTFLISLQEMHSQEDLWLARCIISSSSFPWFSHFVELFQQQVCNEFCQQGYHHKLFSVVNLNFFICYHIWFCWYCYCLHVIWLFFYHCQLIFCLKMCVC